MRAAAKLIGLLSLACAAAAAAMPWKVTARSARSAIEAQIESETGLVVHIDGPIVLKLLPHPRLRFGDVSARSRDGAIVLNVPVVKAGIDALALSHGAWRLSSATLVAPTATLDLDAFRGALFPVAKREPPVRERFRVAARSGVVRLRTALAATDTLITDLDAVLDRDSGAGALSATGVGTWRAARTRFSLRLDDPAAVAEGGSARASLSLRSPLVVATAAGTLTGGRVPRFVGRVSVAAEALSPLERAFETPPLPVALGRILLSADATLKGDEATFSDLALRLGDMRLEGSLAYRGDAGRGLWEGTLATDSLDVDRLFAPARDASDGWFRARLDPRVLPRTDLDLRISAAAMKAGNLAFADAAMSAMVRGDRVELTLEGARAFGGDVKSHVAASLGDGRVEAHADLAMARVDLGPFSAAIGGGERLSGTMDGRVSVDGAGESVSELVHNLSGDGRVTVRDGNLMGMSVPQVLRRFSRRLPKGSDLPGKVTSFDVAEATLKVANGIVAMVDGLIVGPGVRMAFGGRTDLPQGNIHIHAVAAQTDPSGALVPDVPRFPFELRGTWGGPFALDDHPSLPLPSLPPASLGP